MQLSVPKEPINDCKQPVDSKLKLSDVLDKKFEVTPDNIIHLIELYKNKKGADFSYIQWLTDYNPKKFEHKRFLDSLVYVLNHQ